MLLNICVHKANQNIGFPCFYIVGKYLFNLTRERYLLTLVLVVYSDFNLPYNFKFYINNKV